MLEIYYLKAGYIPGEQFALHARRRFRLVPVPGHPNPPQPDMSLFIVHYGPSEPNDRIPAAMVPYDERVNAIMQQRHYLLRAGQIRRKEFMLSDRVNWPSLPELTRQQMGPQMVPRGVPQQMAYPPQPGPGPPAKRARHGPNHGSQQGMMAGMQAIDSTFDDDEDITRGDMFDHLTQREISMSRYQQNHEWMEEILSSAYRINQITPADLNLGLKGELAALTEGIFTAQGAEVFSEAPDRPYIGRLDPGLADEFRKRVSEHTASTLAEIERIQAAHDEAMAKFKESSLFAAKEAELRAVAREPTPDSPAVEGQAESPDEESKVPTKTEEEVVKEVEEAVGRNIESQPLVKRIQQGGYQAPASAALAQMSRQPSRAASQTSGLMMGESDIDMGGTAAGLLDQMHMGFSSMSTPVNNFATPQAHLSAAQSNAATPSNVYNAHNAHNAKSPPPTTAPGPATALAPAPASAPAPAPTPAGLAAQQPGADFSMGGTETPANNQGQKGTTPDQGTGSGDWVVVPKGGEAPDASAGQAHPAAPGGAAAGDTPKPQDAAAGRPPSAAATPAATDGGSATFDQNDFSSLGDLDTAGDALAGFDAPDLDGAAGELGDGLDLQMDMDDSAFGDAFHGVDSSGTPGEGQNQDM